MSMGEPNRWKRHKQLEQDDYMCSSSNSWDAICLTPKKNIYFFGFGVYGSYFRKTMKLTLSWVIGDNVSENYPMEFQVSEMPADKIYSFNITDYGEKPIKVPQGMKIHLRLKATTDCNYQERSWWYGTGGTDVA